MPPKAKGAAKKKGGYQMPEKFNEGTVLKDILKGHWTLGNPIGQGGFGLIYLGKILFLLNNINVFRQINFFKNLK
jgi:hypothetical protein